LKTEIAKKLEKLHKIALIIAKDKKLGLKWSRSAPTAFINYLTNTITLTDNCLPKGSQKYPRFYEWSLEALVSHEAGHRLLSYPFFKTFSRWIDQKRFKNLAKEINNIIEDKRVNYFIEKRYRLDLGKKLRLLYEIDRKLLEKKLEKDKESFNPKKLTTMQIFLAILTNKGLYNSEKFKEKALSLIPESSLKEKFKQDIEKALSLLEKAKFTRLKSELLRIHNEIYEIAKKWSWNCDFIEGKAWIPKLSGGELEIEIDDEVGYEIESQIEKGDQNQEETEGKGKSGSGGFGKSTGEEIPAPTPDFEAYSWLVQKNQPEIQKLLRKLKKTLKPITEKKLFEKQGRLIKPILAKAYVKSLRRRVKRVYIKTIEKFEKEKASFGILVDFSGSVPKNQAFDIITILNEVCGNWLEDSSFSLMVFGANYQKIKTFFESFHNTKARIGGISVSSYATELLQPLEAMFRLFNNITAERRRILIIASDFYVDKQNKCLEVLKSMLKAKIEVILIGFGATGNLKYWLETLKPYGKIGELRIRSPKELPEAFVEVYSQVTGAK